MAKKKPTVVLKLMGNKTALRTIILSAKALSTAHEPKMHLEAVALKDGQEVPIPDDFFEIDDFIMFLQEDR